MSNNPQTIHSSDKIEKISNANNTTLKELETTPASKTPNNNDATSKELQTISGSIGQLFTRVSRGDTEALENDIKMVFNQVTETIEFTQLKPYKLTDEQYAKWPKIKSISLDQKNKQIVTLVFKNNPNLLALKNILLLHNSPFEEDLHTLLLNDGKNHDTTTIRFEANSIDVLAHLIIIYTKMAPEAGALIWEAFRTVVEDSLDKENPRWKQGWSYKVKAWAESIYNEDDTQEPNTNSYHDNTKYNFYDTYTDYDYSAKIEYNNISEDEKQKFLKAIISEFVKLKAFSILSNKYLVIDSQQHETIETSLSSPEKCHLYIKNNIPQALNLSNFTQISMQEEFSNQFEANFWEKISDDKLSKHAKYGGTGVGAGISILDKVAILSKKNPFIQGVSLVIDVSKLVISLLYAQEQIYTKKEEIDITNISQMVAYKSVICNYNSLQTLTQPSFDKLIHFYALFAKAELKDKDDIYKELQENDDVPQEAYISSYLLKMISNLQRINDLNLNEEANELLENINGETFSIASFVLQYNQEECYKEISQVLKGGDKINNKSNLLPDKDITTIPNDNQFSNNNNLDEYENYNCKAIGMNIYDYSDEIGS